MTHLRKMMLEELERRNYARTTIDCYIQTIEDFARHFHRLPDQLTREHIREYQAYLSWSVADTPYPKKTRPLPSILSPEEVAHLIDSSQTRFHRMVLMTLYGAGVRRAELARLQISDIDSRRMVIHIRPGKLPAGISPGDPSDCNGKSSLDESQKKELVRRMKRLLPTQNLEFMIELSADAVAKEMESPTLQK